MIRTMFRFWKRKRERATEAPLPPGVFIGAHWERQGAMLGFGEYRLASFDRGRTWWNIEGGGAAITPADPALSRQIAAHDAVVRLAREHPRFAPSSISDSDDRTDSFRSR